jgi:hypothetical protein
MAVVITSTTSTQEELNHAVSDEWREPPKPAEEPVAAEPEETPTAEGTVETETKEEKPKAKEHKGGWQKRIDKLTARNHSLETRLQELESKLKPAEAPAPPKSNEPKLVDYGNDVEKFLAARDQWKDAEDVRKSDQESQKATFDAYNKKVSEARGQYDDWDETVTGSNMTIPQSVYQEVVESDNGPDVAYYLATHPEETEKLMEMSQSAARRTVIKISDQLAKEKTKPEKAEKPKPSAPITPVGTAATRTGTTLENMSLRDYIKTRNKQERENKRL